MSTLTVLCMVGLLAALQVLGVKLPSNEDQMLIVEVHNELRKHAIPKPANMCKMKWNNEAAINAEKWAETCPSGHSSFEFRKINVGTINCGENIFKSTVKADWIIPVFSWHNESHNFKYGVGSTNGEEIGHYIQVVWYKSNLVGCGRAYCPDDKFKYVTVCHYCPPGNYDPSKPYEIGLPCGACINDCEDGLCTNPCNYDDIFRSCKNIRFWCKYIAGFCPATCICPSNTVQ